MSCMCTIYNLILLKTSICLHISSVERQWALTVAVPADTKAFGSLHKLPKASNIITKAVAACVSGTQLLEMRLVSTAKCLGVSCPDLSLPLLPWYCPSSLWYCEMFVSDATLATAAMALRFQNKSIITNDHRDHLTV